LNHSTASPANQQILLSRHPAAGDEARTREYGRGAKEDE
jgi:hypothetical protein